MVNLGSSPEAQIEQLVGVPGIDVLELFVAAGLCASRGEAKRLLAQGGMTINGRRLAAGEHALADPEFLANKRLLLRKGARDYALVRVE